MKKIFLGIVCFVVVLSNVQALAYNDLSIKYQNNEITGIINLEDISCNNTRCFIFHKLPGYKVVDNMTSNNLAYIGAKETDPLMLGAIQMMILEGIYPDYTFTLLNGEEEINIQEKIEVIKEKLEVYENIIPFDLEYTINYNEPLIIKSDYNLKKYAINSHYAEINDHEIKVMNIKKVGENIIHLTNTLNLSSGYLIYATAPAYKEMDIKVNVLGNIVKFNVGSILNNDYNFIFKLYDQDNNYIGTQSINKDKNEIYYENGIGVKIVSETNSKFNNYDDIILDNNSNHLYEIDYNRPLKKGILSIFSYKDTYFKYPINITIYDLYFNKIDELKGDFYSDIELDYGNYIIYDNNKNSYEFISVSEFNNYQVDNTLRGIISNEDITNISINNEDISFVKNDKFYIFNDQLEINDITFTIDGKKYNDNLTDKNNYFYINNYGYLYNFNRPNEETIINEYNNKIDNTVNEENTDIKVINVPNTSINCELYSYYLYYNESKNKYFFTC